MTSSVILILLCIAIVASYFLSHYRLRSASNSSVAPLQDLPIYYALQAILWCIIPPLLLLIIWLIFDDNFIKYFLLRDLPDIFANLSIAESDLLFNEVVNLLEAGSYRSNNTDATMQKILSSWHYYQNWSLTLRDIAFFVMLLAGLAWGLYLSQPYFRARLAVERAVYYFLMAAAGVAILCTLGIVFSVLWQSLRFFDAVPFFDFIFGLHWNPQIALRDNQVASIGSFGVIPLLVGTLLISAVAMCVAVPFGLMSAIYLAEYAKPSVRTLAKPFMELLAGVPTVVYGFFAALTLAPLLKGLGDDIGLMVSPESALAAGLVMGLMTIPFVASLSDDVIVAVPQSLRESGLGLGATKSEVVRHIVLPAALPGIIGSILLALSRAIGETMIVVMAAGLAAHLTLNPLESVTTVTVQIVTLLVGDQEFDNAKTLAAFALGLFLFVITLCLNLLALWIVRRYREQYE